MSGIKNKVLKTELVEWRKLKELQPKGFKELTKENYEKLKKSIITNNFAMPFTVWESKTDIFIIDGHHRCRVLDLFEKEGVNVPDKLPCTFIDCKDRKEASKLVLMYSSIYSKVQDEGLYEFMNIEGLDFDRIKAEFDIPNIDFERFEEGYIIEKEIKESEEELRAFLKTHILISFPPQKLLLIQDKLKEIIEIEGVEYEQSSN